MRATEPYDGRTVVKWFADRYRPNTLPTPDGSTRLYELPSGATVTVPGPSADRHPVGTSMARRIADALGMTYDEFRSAIGHPVINHGRPSRKPVKPERKGCTRTEVLTAIADVRGALSVLESKLRAGAPRDASFYLAIHSQVLVALAEANHAVQRTTQMGKSNGKEGQVQSNRSSSEKRSAHQVGPHRSNR